ncbi:MAG: hypothetical protein Unbinned4052contig1001_43 [Prokaryotic dsDNA virus sp.]|uniref:hypothetical protein n=1 Tax=Halomonas sp. DP5N14-9 TaxID=2859075 RepID=UPI00118CBDDB|nr:hypothetical protein [Halomonas sp. DP5N14-9]MBY5942801.1 hypothetical protein [Halomonas sp. DP5N14-9]QDP46043.1 MAG: hypothetical protein Unbinned4052contig1001_43 [Prokaryotic dsDNA virus sp.]|tara:strand:+ start:9021 stop:9209 length:189 start_codon:yes stop_codon:yes gene_type:complete
MQLKDMVEALLESGHSQASIAQACGTNQPTIWRAAQGVDIRYSTGREIERLYRRVSRSKRAA